MCPNHHTEIDNKALEGTYTVARVQQMKEDHESRFRTALVSLERIVDGTAGVVVKRPENMRALPGFDNTNEEETRDNLGAAAPFVDGLSRLPSSLRDVITLILVHGRASRTRGRFGAQQVAVPATKVEGVAQIHVDDFRHRAKALEHDGWLEIYDDEGTTLLVLIDPTAREIGWDLFSSIHELAAGDRSFIERIIDQLDFTALDA